MKLRRTTLTIALLLLLYGPGARPDGNEPRQAQTRPAVYVIDSAASELRFLVYRAGALARLGHNHVIVARDLTGHIYRQEALEQSTFQLSIPVDALAVDPKDARAAAGEDFSSAPTAQDITATRRNMLSSRVLDGDQFPTVTVAGLGLTGTLPEVMMSCRITVRGQPTMIQVPATLHVSDRLMTVHGELTLSHRQLGLKPFRVMLGALRVAQELKFTFRLQASRVGSAEAQAASRLITFSLPSPSTVVSLTGRRQTWPM